MPIFLRIIAIDLRNKVADKCLLIKGGEIGAEEIVTCPIKTVMVDLKNKIGKFFS